MAHIPLGASVLTDVVRNKVINVETVNVFDDVRAGNIVTPAIGTKYNFTKDVNLGQIQFVAPAGGEVEISSDNLISNSLTSELTGTAPLFSGDWARLIIRDIDITMTDGNMLDVTSTTDPAPLVQFQNGIFSGGNGLGEVNGALLLWREAGIFNWNSGITIDDNGFVQNTGVQFFNAQFLNIPGVQVTVQGNQAVTLISGNFTVPSSGGSFLKLINDVPDGIQIRDNRIIEALGGNLLAAGSFDQTTVGAFFRNNNSHADSEWIGEVGFEGNATATTILVNTPTNITGTFVSGELERHTHSSGEITYTGLRDVTESIEISASISNGTGGGKRDIQVHLLVDTGLGFSIVSTRGISMDAEAKSVSFTTEVHLVNGDKYKAQIENIENNDSILVEYITIRGKK